MVHFNRKTAALIVFALAVVAGAAVALRTRETSAPAGSAPSAPECITTARTETGRVEYPRSERYAHLPWLGQLFTADDCGADRIAKMFPDGTYRWGSKLRLQRAPSAGLLRTLREVRYTCADDSADSGCLEWRLDNPVPVSDLLKIKPYADEIESDDCINCG